MSEQLNSLRQAAMTLLTAAPASAVLTAMRALLDGLELDRPQGDGAARDDPLDVRRVPMRARGPTS
jgi:hypothetical protein